MEDTQRNKLSMYLAVLGVTERFKADWEPLAGIAAMVTRLEGLAASIQQRAGVQGTSRTGIARGKNRRQVAMIELAAEVAGDVHSFAVAQRDDALAGKSDVEVSDLVNTSDTLVAGRCRELHALGVANAAGIAPLGTTAADLAALAAAIAEYEPLVTAPREATVIAKGVTGELAADFKEADALLKQELDKAMRKFKRKHPEFATAYTNARSIVDLGGGGSSAPDPRPAGSPPPAK